MISRRILAAVALLCALCVPAWAQSTKAALNAAISSNFPDNTSGAITPSVLRTVTSSIVNSIMPTAPVASGNMACFNGTTGLLQDCGSSPSAISFTGPGAHATTQTVNIELLASAIHLYPDYCADNTGTTDCATAITNALNDACTLGKALYIPAGTYRGESSISWNVNACRTKVPVVWGDGISNSVIAMDAGFSFAIVGNSSAPTFYNSLLDIGITGNVNGVLFQFGRTDLTDQLNAVNLNIWVSNSSGGASAIPCQFNAIFGTRINAICGGPSATAGIASAELNETQFVTFTGSYSGNTVGMYLTNGFNIGNVIINPDIETNTTAVKIDNAQSVGNTFINGQFVATNGFSSSAGSQNRLMNVYLANTTNPIVGGTGLVIDPIVALASGQIYLGATAGFPTATSTPILGVPGSVVGSIGFGNATSGTQIIAPATGALGSGVATLPAGSYNLVGDSLTQALTNKTINGNTIAPGTGTLALGAGKTATVSNTLTFTGTDGSSVAFGTGGTLPYLGGSNVWTGGNQNQAYFTTAQVSQSLVNGLNSNIANAANSFMYITGPTGAFSIGGFQTGAGITGYQLKVYNSTSQTMTIVNEDASSTAANRIHTLSGANVVLRTSNPSFATFIYDATGARWILESTN